MMKKLDFCFTVFFFRKRNKKRTQKLHLSWNFLEITKKKLNSNVLWNINHVLFLFHFLPCRLNEVGVCFCVFYFLNFFLLLEEYDSLIAMDIVIMRIFSEGLISFSYCRILQINKNTGGMIYASSPWMGEKFLFLLGLQ